MKYCPSDIWVETAFCRDETRPRRDRMRRDRTRNCSSQKTQTETRSRLLTSQFIQIETFRDGTKSGRDGTRQRFSSRLAENFSTSNFSTHPYYLPALLTFSQCYMRILFASNAEYGFKLNQLVIWLHGSKNITCTIIWGT